MLIAGYNIRATRNAEHLIELEELKMAYYWPVRDRLTEKNILILKQFKYKRWYRKCCLFNP